ncbi:V-type proton ATPase subunit d 1 [Thelohanellus kitauei]|uniref:V-type proton ATPase subunit n=1 Tax=Thelohanellus kitauei TaxID=669202 RepID=A0A0C2JIT2_THEKT|nr:V-type proton ATPase subunit d 1 [Thelohanellus kitauei]
MDYLSFNSEFGYLEALVRGYKSTMLTKKDYQNMVQSENLDDIKLNLMTTEYAAYVANLASPITVQTLEEKINQKMVKEFMYLRSNATEPLSTFLDYVSYGYMINNICLLISGTVNHRSVAELMPRCHPLGMFDQIPTIGLVSSASELYNVILVDTPLAKFFAPCVSEEQFDEMHVEVIRSTVYKTYLEEFFCLCEKIGGTTFEIMKPLLEYESDRRCFSIAMNSLGTLLKKEERLKFFPRCGKLGPTGLNRLAKVDNYDEIKEMTHFYPEYYVIFNDNNHIFQGKTPEDRFFEYDVKINLNSFYQQFSFAVFYSYFKLSEQQHRNIIWISECVSQNNKSQVDEYIAIA